MTRAFVLPGGGNLGAVQVGMLLALAEDGIEPDLLVGTSVGALNAAYVAGVGSGTESIDGLAEVWLDVGRRDVFRIDPLRQVLALIGRRPSLCSSAPLRHLIETTLTFGELGDAVIPVHLTATNVLTGEGVSLDRGNAVDAVLASAALPGVFESVVIDGVALWDGGVADNAGISRAISLGADEVWVLPTGYACALPGPPPGALAAALHAVSLLSHQRMVLEVADCAGRVDLHVVPPLCPLSISPIDFGQTADLIDRAHRTTRAWLADGAGVGAGPLRDLALHGHSRSKRQAPATDVSLSSPGAPAGTAGALGVAGAMRT